MRSTKPEKREWVLESKSTPGMWLQLTHTQRGRAKTPKADWQLTDDFDLAAPFTDSRDIDHKLKQHRVPAHLMRVRSYNTTFQQWLATNPPRPHIDANRD